MKDSMIFRRMALFLIASAILSACSPNPKKKCNTCPKWTSELPSGNNETARTPVLT
ncbi:MAG: hypothetical protein ABR572_06830 [Cryomorphaceae bacterium]